jgi:hypothetical protein
MHRLSIGLRCCVAVALAVTMLSLSGPRSVSASSHQDAPVISRLDAVNTTDVYSFVSEQNGVKYLSTALAVYPHEEPGVGPNIFGFETAGRYNIHVALGPDVAAGRATFTYTFQFATQYKNVDTILQSYLGVIQNVNDAGQNRIQTYTVTRTDNRTGLNTNLGGGQTLLTPPNNEGMATPLYNVGDNGDSPAKPGVDRGGALDTYTAQTVYELNGGYQVFAGQREDGFYADILSIFDLLKLRNTGFDSQGGFNVHMIALNIPVSQLGGDFQIVGVYATTEQRAITIVGNRPILGQFVQVGRQGNPLFNEGLVALRDKDRYNSSRPISDNTVFRKYAENPELARLLNALVFGAPLALETGRTDIAGIFIPDLIKTDLSTPPARLAGGGRNASTNPDDPGFSRLGIFGGFVPSDGILDVLQSRIPGAGFLGNGTQPGGWPNGRRFGDDVTDIAIIALASDLRNPVAPVIPPAPLIEALTDGTNKNDAVYNKVFPYGGTPLNGRVHDHEPETGAR